MCFNSALIINILFVDSLLDLSKVDSYEDVFHRAYNFILEPTDNFVSWMRGFDIFISRLAVQQDLPFAPLSRAYMSIRIQHNEFLGRVLSSKDSLLTLEVRRLKEIDALILNDQVGYFICGNPHAAFLVGRQAVLDVFWGRHNIPSNNWLKHLLLGHENQSIEHQHLGNPKPHPPSEAHRKTQREPKESLHPRF